MNFSQEDVLVILCKILVIISKERLGYDSEEIDTKPIRSAVAMSMFMADTHVFMITLMGRWLSDASLK